MFRVLVRLVVPRRQAVAVWGAVGHGALGPAPPHLGHEEVHLAACDAPAVWGDPLVQRPGSIQIAGH